MITRHSQAGFKFWEITVVLAIIALVAAILFPVFQKTRPHSPRRSCQSQMKQLGFAFVQYVQDSDELMPRGVNAAGNGWAGEIYSYTKTTEVYHCPDDEHDGPYVSYAENQNVAKQNLGNFAAPAATVELYEFTTLNCDPSSGYPKGPSSSAAGDYVATGPMETVSTTGLAAPQNSTRHDTQAYSLNFLTVDGHAKYLKPGQVSSGPNAARPSTLKPGGNKGTVDGKSNLTFAIK